MERANRPLRIMNWNARSIMNKKQEFFHFISVNSIDIILMSETHLKSNLSCSHSDFMTYRLDRERGQGGGVAIFIRKSLKHELIPCPRTEVIEALSLKVFCGNQNFIVTSAYYPGSNDSRINRKYERDLDLLTSRPKFLIGGDFNSRNEFWNCVRNNLAGRTLNQKIQNDDILLYHPDSHTHFPRSGAQPSTIDLFLTKNITLSNIQTDHSFTSDHVPVICELLADVRIIEDSSNQTFVDYEHANWNGFKRRIELELNRIENDLTNPQISTTDIDESLSRFNDIVMQSDRAFIPRKRKIFNNLRLNEDILMLIRRRRARIRRLHRTQFGDPLIRDEIKLLTQRIRFEIDNQINLRFSNSVERISRDPGTYKQKLWKLTKTLKKRPKPIPTIHFNNDKLTTNEEKASAFADHFRHVHDQVDTRLYNDVTSRRVRSSLGEIESGTVDVSSIPEVTSSVIRDQIRNLKSNKTPGFDLINNRHLKNLPNAAYDFIRDLFNACLRLNYFPKPWKHGKVRSI